MGFPFIQSAYIPGIVSFILCILLTPLVILLAKSRGWVVAPRKDRWHTKPTALMGGISIFAAFLIAMFLTGPGGVNWFIFGACVLMFVTGLVDDLIELQPIFKLLVQVACAFLLIYQRYTFGNDLLSWIGIPLTFFWVIGITNAINLLDNMDGLASGLSCIIAVISGIILLSAGDTATAAFAFAIAGATLGFCFYNFNPARIFMGDSGSLFLGFSIAFLSLSVQKSYKGTASPLLMLLVPIGLLAIPILDTSLVTVKRLSAGRKISQGGKDHTSHRLVALGLSEKKAVVFLYLVCLVWGVLCLFIRNIDLNLVTLLVLLLTFFSIVLAITLSGVKVYSESEEQLSYQRNRGIGMKNNALLRLLFMNKKMILGIFADIMIINVAFFLAAKSTGVRFEGEYSILAFFICIKIMMFYAYNLYNRMWRYVSMKELSGYFVSLLLATLLIAVSLYLAGHIKLYNQYFFLVDFLLSFTGIIFSRLVYRGLRESFSSTKAKGKRALIYGAGDKGILLFKELTQNEKYDLKPVGWIDDDVSKHNMHVYGLKVFGGVDAIEKAMVKTGANTVIISSTSISAEQEQSLRLLLENRKINMGRFTLNLLLEEV